MNDDKALKAARDALKRTQRTKAMKTPAPAQHKLSASGEIVSAIKPLAAWNKIETAFDVIWNGWLKPITRFLSPITKRIVRFYRWSFASFAYKGPKTARVFSRSRASFTILALAALTIAAPFILVWQIIPVTSRTIYDAGMLITMKEDNLFLGRAEVINADRQLYQVMGCRDISGCDGGDNTTYYRLRDNIILDIKYWTTRFEPYDPAEIAGAMVSELNDCAITYYGRRSKALGWYPYIVSASCTPV